MTKAKKYFGILALSVFSQLSLAQGNFYTTSGGEMLFQWSEVTDGGPVNTNLRWTIFLHLGTYAHYDFNNNIGMFSGIALRNVGFITNIGTEKKIRRTYNLGIPLAVKVGLFTYSYYCYQQKT